MFVDFPGKTELGISSEAISVEHQMAIHTDEMKKKIYKNIFNTKNTFVRVPFAFFLNGILSFWNFDGTVQQRELIN